MDPIRSSGEDSSVGVVPATPSPEALDVFKRYKENTGRLGTSWGKLPYRHPNEWVAITDDCTLFADKDHDSLLRRLADEGQLSTAAIEFVSTDVDRFIAAT